MALQLTLQESIKLIFDMREDDTKSILNLIREDIRELRDKVEASNNVQVSNQYAIKNVAFQQETLTDQVSDIKNMLTDESKGPSILSQVRNHKEDILEIKNNLNYLSQKISPEGIRIEQLKIFGALLVVIATGALGYFGFK